jgi:hypothetical protein
MRLKKFFELLIGKPCIFDDGFKTIGVQSLMIRNGYAVSSIGHTDVLASGYNFESDLTEYPDRTLGRDISKKHSKQEPQAIIRDTSHFNCFSLI